MTEDPGSKPQNDGPPAEVEAMPEENAEAQAEAEITELKDRLLRALAETENVRRRSEREVADARQYAIASLARDILTVGDNFQRSIAAFPAGGEAGESVLQALLEGVKMTEREFLNVLARHGIRRIEPNGERFDPNLHQAMYEVASPDMPSGLVVEVIQPGYLLRDRTLRPALVAVSKAMVTETAASEPSAGGEAEAPAGTAAGDNR
jgi:molecular chaperone GrpE